jgi:nitroreductase
MNSNENLIKQLEWRYATKLFNSEKKISATDWETLAKVIQLTPSSYGLPTWKVILVENTELRKKLRASSWNQPQIEDCSHLVVFATLKTVTKEHVKNFIKLISTTRGIPTESLEVYENMILGDIVNGPRASIASEWTRRQAYIAIGFLLEAAATLNIDACPLEGLDPSQYDSILELNDTEYATIAAVALGYRSENDKHQSLKKVRPSINEMIEVRS